jgi:hypothetical protein
MIIIILYRIGNRDRAYSKMAVRPTWSRHTKKFGDSSIKPVPDEFLPDHFNEMIRQKLHKCNRLLEF